MTNGPIEPNAEMRQLATTLRQMYLALCQEGFTATEAMGIIGATIASSNGGRQ